MLVPEYKRGHVMLEDGGKMPYAELGEGRIRTVMILGAGDGLSTAYDSARSLAWFYRKRARDFRMLILSRRERIPQGYTPEQHAEDYAEALDTLGWRSVLLECNSAGGPIGQQISVRRPELVRGLVLASTAHRLDEQAQTVISRWLQLIEQREWGEFAWDSSIKTYRSLNCHRWLAPVAKPLLGVFDKPAEPDRLKRLLRGLLGIDNGPILSQVSRPTLIFGGADDPIFGAALQREMAGLISGSRLILQPGYLHGADLESLEYGVELDKFARQLGKESPP